MRMRRYPGRAVVEGDLHPDSDSTHRVMELLYEASWQECRDKCLLKRSKSLRTIDPDSARWEADDVRRPKSQQLQGEFWEHRRGIGWTRKFHPHELRQYPETFPPRHYENLPRRDIRMRQRRSSTSSVDMPPEEDPQEEEFAIPRPKLIVPVHTYGIRKRRTGNMLHRPTGTREMGCGDGGGECCRWCKRLRFDRMQNEASFRLDVACFCAWPPAVWRCYT
jgi:hypothetical protein